MNKDNASAHMSGNYDTDVRKTIPYYAEIHKETLETVRAYRPEPSIWLDTGCGTGSLVMEACDLFPGTEFYLSDPSQAMLEKAAEKLRGERYGRVHILGAHGSEDLEWKLPERPDVVTAIQSHHYLDRDGRKKAVKNCCGILAVSGIFVTFENIRPESPLGVELSIKRWKAFQLEKGKSQNEADKHLARFDTEFFPVTVKEHLDILTGAGFSTVGILWYSVMQAGFYAVK